MSTTAVPIVPREMRFGIAEQTAYGTAVGDASAFIELDCGDAQFIPDVKILDTGGGRGSRVKADGAILTHTRGAMPSITLEGIAKVQEIGQFIYAAGQSVSEESGTAPFKKTFTVHSTQPDFSANAGHVLTVVQRFPGTTSSYKVKDMVCRSLTLTWENGEPLRYSAELVGLGEMTTANPSGTWTVSTQTFLHAADIDRVKANFGGSTIDFNMESFELAMTAALYGVGQDGAGAHNVIAMTERELTWKLKVQKDADSPTFRENFKGNTPLDIHIGSGSSVYGAVTADFNFDIHGKIKETTEGHDAIVAFEASGECTDADGGTTAALTIVTAPGNSHGW